VFSRAHERGRRRLCQRFERSTSRGADSPRGSQSERVDDGVRGGGRRADLSTWKEPDAGSPAEKSAITCGREPIAGRQQARQAEKAGPGRSASLLRSTGCGSGRLELLLTSGSTATATFRLGLQIGMSAARVPGHDGASACAGRRSAVRVSGVSDASGSDDGDAGRRGRADRKTRRPPGPRSVRRRARSGLIDHTRTLRLGSARRPSSLAALLAQRRLARGAGAAADAAHHSTRRGFRSTVTVSRPDSRCLTSGRRIEHDEVESRPRGRRGPAAILSRKAAGAG